MGKCLSSSKGRHDSEGSGEYDAVAQDGVAICTPVTKQTTTGENKQHNQAITDSIKSYMEGLPFNTADNTNHSNANDTITRTYTNNASTPSTNMMEYFHLGIAVAEAQRKETMKNRSYQIKTIFVPHMSVEDANKLHPRDSIDYRLECGKFVYAEISKKTETSLNMQYMGKDGNVSESECDFTQHIYRFAKPLTISQRVVNDPVFIPLDINDYIDINPIHSVHPGWKQGIIKRFEYNEHQKLQCEIEYEHNGNIYQCWSHLDNRNEVQKNGTNAYKCCKVNNTAQKTRNSSTDDIDSKAMDTKAKNATNGSDDDVEYVLLKEGWIELYDRFSWTQWKKVWMMLYGDMLQFFVDQDKEKNIASHNLTRFTRILETGTITFSIYKGSSEDIQCRVIDADLKERASWIKCIQQSMCIDQEVSDDDDGDTEITYPEHDQFFIHTDFSAKFDRGLKCKFVENKERHCEILLYNKTPVKDDDKVIRIDLVYDKESKEIKDNEEQKSIVRIQSKSWGDFKRREMNNDQYPVYKSLSEIIKWCIEYQNAWPTYDTYTGRHCRAFMIELCAFLGIKYPNSYPFEGLLYEIGKLGRKCNNPSLVRQNEGNITTLNNEQQKKVNDNEESMDGEQWKCPKCTFLNSIHLPFCDMCSNTHDSFTIL